MKVGIIGCGHMGSGIAKGLATHHEVFLYGRQYGEVELLAQKIKAKPIKSISDLVKNSEMIILAVKPKDLPGIIDECAEKLSKKQIVVSVLAGITLQTLTIGFKKATVIRMMPNLAIVQGEGVVGLSSLDTFDHKQRELMTKLFLPLGLVKWIPETLMDSITALTGSGPAFMLVMIEAMVDAAIKMGFNAVEGQELVLQMIQGSVAMLKQTKKHPAELKWEIASPGGTTIAGLNELEGAGLRSAIIRTFLAAFDRSKAMS